MFTHQRHAINAINVTYVYHTQHKISASTCVKYIQTASQRTTKTVNFFVNITKNDLSWWWCPFPSLNGVQGRHVYCLYFMHTHSCSHYLMCSKQIVHKISHVEGCYRVQLLSHEDRLYTGTDRGTGTLSENITLEQK